LEFQNTFQKLKWPFCFIGGLAVIRWGEIRMTQDIDLCLLCGFGNEEKYIDSLLIKFRSRIKEAKEFALKNRVLLLYASNDVPVDISLSGMPFEIEMIEHSTLFEFHNKCSLITCSAEDLVILKAFADRTKDWMDVESIILRHGKKLDKKYIKDQLTFLCELKESPEIVKKLEDLFIKRN
jgi:hypothetical protein